eukprot:jgi/Botrbrau1/15974/Bobra.0375s0001.1
MAHGISIMPNGPGPSPAFDKYHRPNSYHVQVECSGDGSSGSPDSKHIHFPSPGQRDFSFPNVHPSPPQWAPTLPNTIVPAGQPIPNLSVQLPQELPENVEINTKSLRDMQLLWEEWHVLERSQMPADQVCEEMKRLAHRTGSAVGAASQGAITRQQMQELLIYATDVMSGRDECLQAAQFLLRLADNLQTIPASRSGALVTNIVTGGRQHMTGPSQHQSTRPSVRTGINTQVESQTRAAALVKSKNTLMQKLASANMLQLAGAAVAAVMAWEGMKRGALKGRRQFRRQKELFDRRRLQCEASNARAYAYLRELRANRFNPLWHDPPPMDACPYAPQPGSGTWYSPDDSPYHRYG